MLQQLINASFFLESWNLYALFSPFIEKLCCFSKFPYVSFSISFQDSAQRTSFFFALFSKFNAMFSGNLMVSIVCFFVHLCLRIYTFMYLVIRLRM